MFRTPQVNLYTDDVGGLRDFYLGLGFRETFAYAPAGVPEHVEVELDGFSLGIAGATAARRDHGLDPRLDGRAAEIVLWCDDTDGNPVQLVQRAG